MRSRRSSQEQEQFKAQLTELFGRVKAKTGAIARQNFSCCGSCASYELSEKAKPGQAFLFYHRQDAQGLPSCKVNLAYGIKVGDDEWEQKAVEFAIKVRDEAVKVGLEVVWDGTSQQRLFVSLPLPPPPPTA